MKHSTPVKGILYRDRYTRVMLKSIMTSDKKDENNVHALKGRFTEKY